MQCLDHPTYGRVAKELNKWRCFWIHFLFTFVYYLFLGVGWGTCAHGGQKTSCKSVLPFGHSSPWELIKVVRLSQVNLHSLSHLSNPDAISNNYEEMFSFV